MNQPVQQNNSQTTSKEPVSPAAAAESLTEMAQVEVVPPKRIVDAEYVADAKETQGKSSFPFWFCGVIASAFEYVIGLIGMFLGLSFVATIPGVQLLSLGYLLEASGRVAESGRIRDGFIGIRPAARLTTMFAGAWLFLQFLRFLADWRYSAHLIDSQSGATRQASVILLVVTILCVGHILAAWYCGGRLRHFFWPILAIPMIILWGTRFVLKVIASSRPLKPIVDLLPQRLLADICYVHPLTNWFPPAIILSALARRKMYSEARDAVWSYLEGMRLWYFFWMGARGFAGAFLWLLIPVSLVAGATILPFGPSVVAGIVGVPLLVIVILYLPFLQTHFALENRFSAMFEVGRVRQLFRQAPIAFWFALLITLLFALPLYLLKIELTPREMAFLPSLVFITFIFPARLLTGWAVGRARRRELPRFFVSRWGARLAALPVAGAFVLIVYLTRYVSWYGAWSLFEQHAFLLPVPFLGV